VLTQPPLLIDLLTSGWVLVVFVILFGLIPLIAFAQVSLPSIASRIVGAFVRTMMTISIGSILWTKLGLFTWLIAVLVYLTGLGIGWLASHKWQFRANLQQLGQQIAISTIDIFDRGLSIPQLIGWLRLPWRSIDQSIQIRNAHSQRLQQPYQWSLPLILLKSIGMIAMLGGAMWLRFEHPFTEFRFSYPDTYSQLLITQQILARDLPAVNYLPIFPSLAAFLSALSGIHPVQVVHLLGAIVGTLLVLSVGYTTRCLTKNGAAALAASYSLGAYLFTWNLPISSRLPLAIQQSLGTIRDTLNTGLIRSWAGSELELGALFVILAIGCSTHINRATQRNEATINTLCCVLLVAIIAPNLLILVLFGGLGIIFGRQMALFSISMAWPILAVLAAIPDRNFPMLKGVLVTLPIGLSLTVGLLFVAIAAAARLLLATWSAPICLTVFIAITLNFSLPSLPQIDYLEYDATARKAVEISRLFPHHQWTVVAPIEQLSQVYGRGWYEDAAQFTKKYQDRVSSPNFRFPHQTSLFVFVEKRPFTTDKPEYPVPYSVLVDPTYRHYRSPSGRAQLATATLKLCETYRRHHPDSRIYYESDRLQIYQFAAHPQQVPPASVNLPRT
jgi:hypothetical protein